MFEIKIFFGFRCKEVVISYIVHHIETENLTWYTFKDSYIIKAFKLKQTLVKFAWRNKLTLVDKTN